MELENGKRIMENGNRMENGNVSKNRGTPKSFILTGISIINHPFWGFSPLFLVQHPNGLIN